MNANAELITHFYMSFQKRDYKAMQACYADNATFNDTIFKNLTAAQVKAMWEMLLSKSKDLGLEFSNVSANGNTGKAHWDAFYTFSATGNKVVNRIDAQFEIVDGKIVKHTDQFDFYTWAKQAFGFKGMLLGWTGFFQQKVRAQALKNLDAYMAKKA